jgi:hypothetical protein
MLLAARRGADGVGGCGNTILLRSSSSCACDADSRSRLPLRHSHTTPDTIMGEHRKQLASGISPDKRCRLRSTALRSPSRCELSEPSHASTIVIVLD